MRNELELSSSSFRPSVTVNRQHILDEHADVDDYLGDIMQDKESVEEEETYNGEDFDHSDDELRTVVAQLSFKARNNPRLSTHLSQKERDSCGDDSTSVKDEEEPYDVDWEGDDMDMHSPTPKASRKKFAATATVSVESQKGIVHNRQVVGDTNKIKEEVNQNFHSNQLESDRNEVLGRPHTSHDDYADEDFDA
jgi:hypothetical protein